MKEIRIAEEITLKELATLLNIEVAKIIKMLLKEGKVFSANQVIGKELAKRVAESFGYKVCAKIEKVQLQKELKKEGVERPPVITVMGHVDHGKTLLLDAIRQTNVAEKEPGGITQHIGAYMVKVDGRCITFIDTPGHEAFATLRARGAQVTDIVVLVVAADDGVMPQTLEAINHARAADVPIVVAVNKCDLPNADPEKVRRQLAQIGLVPEEWGGQTIFVNISAKRKEGLKELLEMVLLEAEMLELKAEPQKPASGTVIEAKLDRRRGPVATFLVQEGTLRLQDTVVVGEHFGKVRAIFDERGNSLKEATLSAPVQVLGLNGVPDAGERFFTVKDEKEAKRLAEQKREASLRKRQRATLIGTEPEEEEKEFALIIKADVQGSLDAVRHMLEKLYKEKVKLKIVHEAVGDISASDIMLASTTGAMILGFNAYTGPKEASLADSLGVQIRNYRVIYDMIEEMQRMMEGVLEPIVKEVVIGKAEVRKLFKISKVGIVAGCYVQEGRVRRGERARVLRGAEVLHEGKILSLRRFKDDVTEVAQGFECGLRVEGFEEYREGDLIEVVSLQREER